MVICLRGNHTQCMVRYFRQHRRGDVGIQVANTPVDWIERNLPERESWEWPENAVRGESYRQIQIAALPGVSPIPEEPRCDLVVVEFQREPRNPVDPFASRALVAGVHVGYLAKEYAAELAQIVDRAHISSWKVAGAVVGGTDGAPSFGVHVWLDHRLTRGPRPPSVALQNYDDRAARR